jgi:hypothetical protein
VTTAAAKLLIDLGRVRDMSEDSFADFWLCSVLYLTKGGSFLDRWLDLSESVSDAGVFKTEDLDFSPNIYSSFFVIYFTYSLRVSLS